MSNNAQCGRSMVDGDGGCRMWEIAWRDLLWAI